MRTETPPPVRLQDYRPTDYAIPAITLDVRLAPERTRVVARLTVEPREGTAPGTPLVLDGDELKLVRLTLDEGPLPDEAYAAAPDRLTLRTPPARRFTLEIETELNPSANTKLMGLYRSGGTYCTQCEAEGFRRITYFLDRPDVLSVYTTRIEARMGEAPVLLSNGNLVESGEISGTDRHFALWHDPFPKPAYLFALVGGDLGVVKDTFVTASGRRVELRIYCEHGKESRCAWAMDSLKRAMRWDERVFGREYDLDIFMIVAVSDFNMGAMENKGLNIFNDKYVLADADVATDTDYAHVEGVIAHEYFHNWTGNRITCRDWFQLCLKEGLTVFRDQEFSSDERSRPVKRIADVRTLRAQQFPEDAGPLAHPVRPSLYHEINNFYTATVYEKGAEIVRMLKTILGDEGFRAGMDLYFERHDGDAATIEDFLACFAEATGRDLSQFALWYEQAGTPELKVTESWDGEAGAYTLTLEQLLPETPDGKPKKPMHIPVRLGLIGKDGRDLPLRPDNASVLTDDVLHLTEPRQSVVFRGLSEKPVPSLLRGFSAPVKLAFARPNAELLFLMRNDADPFNRWQAAQDMATRLLIEGTAAARAGQPVPIDEEFIAALGALAGDEELDAAFRAQVLALPTEADIARDIGKDVDPDAIATARSALRGTAAGALRRRLRSIVDALTDTGPFSPDAASAGRRALRNTALDLMAADGDEAALERVASEFANAGNMTDRLAALATLNQFDVPQRTAALDHFYERYADTPLVVDKWLSLQASAPLSGTLDAVKALTRHPAFSFSNPNRVRALVGAFAAMNPTQFNRPDGAGYAFLADVVLALDPKNPQLAARLLASFRSWRALEPGRRGRAEAELKRIAAAEGLSRDVRDIVTRSLA